MNDAEVISEVRDRFGEVQMDTALETVVSRGRSLRRRRTIPGAVVAVAAAVVVALAATGTLPGRGPRADLAAWTVTRTPAGLVTVTVRQLNDPAGLQRTLRADGVPSFVRFRGETPAVLRDLPAEIRRCPAETLPRRQPRGRDGGPDHQPGRDPRRCGHMASGRPGDHEQLRGQRLCLRRRAGLRQRAVPRLRQAQDRRSASGPGGPCDHGRPFAVAKG